MSSPEHGSIDQRQSGTQSPIDGVSHALHLAREGQVYVTRRLLAKALSPLPKEFVDEEEAEQNIQKLVELRGKGFGAIVPYLHFGRRETIDVPVILAAMSRDIARARFLEPLALHQDNLIVKAAGTLVDLERKNIVTKDTVERGKNIVKPPLKDVFVSRIRRGAEPPSPKVLKEGHGVSQYSEAAIEVLGQQGIILLAPQGGRRSSLGKPERRPIELLIRQAQRHGVDNVAVMPISIALKDVSTYDKTTTGYNWGRTHQIAILPPRTVEEYRAYAEENGRTIDEQVFADIGSIAPDSYKNG